MGTRFSQCSTPSVQPLLPQGPPVAPQRALRRQNTINLDSAHTNFLEFKDWMLESSNLWYPEDVEKAFDIIEKDLMHNNTRVQDAQGDVEDLVCGPALKHCLRSNYWTWGSFVIILLMAKECSFRDKDGIALFPHGAGLIVVLGVWLFGTLMAFYEEYSAAMYVLPSQAISVGGKYNHESFDLWICKMLIVSLVYRADILTAAVFIGRVWNSCNFCDELNNRWTESVRLGPLHHFPVLRDLPFDEFVLFGALVMFSQFVYALCYSYPTSPNLADGYPVHEGGRFEWADYKIVEEPSPQEAQQIQFLVPPMEGDRGQDRQVRAQRELDRQAQIHGFPTSIDSQRALHCRARICRFHTLGRRDQGYGRAVQALVESGRMNLPQWNDDYYIAQAEKAWGARVVTGEMRRTFFRFILFALQGVFITNFQVTFLGILRSHDIFHKDVTDIGNSSTQVGQSDLDSLAAHSNLFTAASTVITALLGLKYVIYELGAVLQHLWCAKPAVDEFKANASVAHNHEQRWEGRWLQWRYIFSVVSTVFLSCGFFFPMGIYIGCKVVMSMVVCSSGSWNVHWPLGDGCVDLAKITVTSCGRATLNKQLGWLDAVHAAVKVNARGYI